MKQTLEGKMQKNGGFAGDISTTASIFRFFISTICAGEALE